MQRLLPPMLFAPLLDISLVVGVLLPVVGPMPWAVRWIGAPVIAVGLWLNLGGAGLFSRVGTNIKTFDDPDQLVTEGPFRFTRNPMYLGFMLMLSGASLLIGSLTAWIGPLVFLAAAQLWYIPFEEERMRTTFGDAYDDYCDRVPRWVGPVRSTP